jgi:hypothetical protein
VNLAEVAHHLDDVREIIPHLVHRFVWSFVVNTIATTVPLGRRTWMDTAAGSTDQRGDECQAKN